MHRQLSVILVPPAGADLAAFEQFLFEQALPAAEQTVLTRITTDVRQDVLKGEDETTQRTYYLWQAELELMTDQGTVAPGLIDEMLTTLRGQLATQNATVTAPLTPLPQKHV